MYRYSAVVVFDSVTETYLADVPTLGFQTYGFSVDHAFDMATEAIAGRLDVMREIGETIPVEDHPPELRRIAV